MTNYDMDRGVLFGIFGEEYEEWKEEIFEVKGEDFCGCTDLENRMGGAIVDKIVEYFLIKSIFEISEEDVDKVLDSDDEELKGKIVKKFYEIVKG